MLLGMALLVAVVGSACGQSSTLGASSLAKRSEAVQSLAAEGALLAGDTASGRSTAPYRREHASELAEAAAKAATSLGAARTTAALAPRLRLLHGIALHVGSQLRALEGATEAEARRLARELQAAADSSEKLGAGLA